MAEETNKLNDFVDSSMINTPTSQTFIDPDGKVGRKGMLTLVDPIDGSSKFVWAVSNAKVLVFYQSQHFLTIVKLIRNSTLNIKDVVSTPCFIIVSTREVKEGGYMVCSSSIQEKEVWVETIKTNINLE